MNKLTKDRVERAIEHLTALRGEYISAAGFTSNPKHGRMFRDRASHLKTALDAVRWRSPETMPDYHDVLVAFRRSDGSLGCAITVKLEIPEYVTVLGWRPVLMWEEEG